MERARQNKVVYVTYYDKLLNTYNVSTCKTKLMTDHFDKWTSKIVNAANDIDSKLSRYKSINPNLIPHKDEKGILEHERILITRYRCGAHNLRIETGRWQRIDREQRLCQCNESVQTLLHVVTQCPLMRQHKLIGVNTLEDFFKLDYEVIGNYICNISKVLKIKIW